MYGWMDADLHAWQHLCLIGWVAAMTYGAKQCMRVGDFLSAHASTAEPICFIIGAIAHGSVCQHSFVHACKKNYALHFPFPIIAYCTCMCYSILFQLWFTSLAYSLTFFIYSQLNISYHDQDLAVSEYPMSAAGVCAKLTDAFEQFYGIL
jgi:hypothetical protein